MRDVGKGTELPLEPVKRLVPGAAQRLQGDDAVSFTVERLVYHAERTRPQPARDLETRGPPKRFVGKVRHLHPLGVLKLSMLGNVRWLLSFPL